MILTNKTQGFTLIELVMVIIIIGILSVSVLPKFFSSSGYEEYTYRSEIIALLRVIQLRSLQQTGGNVCNQVALTNKQLIDGCGNSVVKVADNHEVTFSVNGGPLTFSFDSLGRPSCLANCTITITGVEETLAITIETQGYIHAI